MVAMRREGKRAHQAKRCGHLSLALCKNAIVGELKLQPLPWGVCARHAWGGAARRIPRDRIVASTSGGIGLRLAATSCSASSELRMRVLPLIASLTLSLLLTACGDRARLTETAGMGAPPTLPPPNSSLIPTVDIAPAKGWPADKQPIAAPGLTATLYTKKHKHPHKKNKQPNGDVLVAESNAPPRPEDGKGIKGWVMKKVKKRAGAGVPSANRITLLRDANGDGVVDTRSVFLQGLNSPFGMALVGENFYVANTDAVLRFPYREGDLKISAAGVKVADLPGGPLNHHCPTTTLAPRDGTHLNATAGSNSNAAENGIEKENGRAAIYEIDLATGVSRVFASGLRNPNGLGWQPEAGELWTVVNERDELVD